MSLENIVCSVSGRLSVRELQAESLRRLHWAVDQVPALRDAKARSPEELKAMQDALTGQFPTLADFERDFPSLCFALAIGIGKTRLMGAFISSPRWRPGIWSHRRSKVPGAARRGDANRIGRYRFDQCFQRKTKRKVCHEQSEK